MKFDAEKEFEAAVEDPVLELSHIKLDTSKLILEDYPNTDGTDTVKLPSGLSGKAFFTDQHDRDYSVKFKQYYDYFKSILFCYIDISDYKNVPDLETAQELIRDYVEPYLDGWQESKQRGKN